MPQPRKILRAITWVFAGLSLMILVLAAAIRFDQYMLRRHAEQLLSDLKSLEMRKSTYSDARRAIDRWKADVPNPGPCDPGWCDVQISLANFYERHPTFFGYRVPDRIYRLLCGRPALIYASIRVRKNIVWGKGIRAFVETPDRPLSGEATSGSPNLISPLHPEYEMLSWSGCCQDAQVVFTPYTDPTKVNQLMDIDFSCLTRWHSCEAKQDILPTAWKEAMAEERSASNSVQPGCSQEAIRVLSRESARVAIAEVTSAKAVPLNSCFDCTSGKECIGGKPCADRWSEITIRLDQDFKPWNFRWPLGDRDYHFHDSFPITKKIGDKYIVFSDYPPLYQVDPRNACMSIVPVTPENMEMVRRGVAEDWADHNAEFLSSSPGLGDLKPPAIDVH